MGRSIKCNLKKIRKMRGLTQVELSKLTGITQRMIAHYENNDCQIPSDNIIKLSKSLKVTTDEILGTKSIRDGMKPEEAKLWKKIKKMVNLPKKEQQSILEYMDALYLKLSLKKSN